MNVRLVAVALILLLTHSSWSAETAMIKNVKLSGPELKAAAIALERFRTQESRSDLGAAGLVVTLGIPAAGGILETAAAARIGAAITGAFGHGTDATLVANSTAGRLDMLVNWIQQGNAGAANAAMQGMAQTAAGQAELASITQSAVRAMPYATSVEQANALQSIIRTAGPLGRPLP